MSTITAYGWELHLIGGTADKFYRVIVIGNWTITQWGRRDTAGQVKVYEFGSQRDALHKARDKSNEKDDKGYEVTRDLTAFEVYEHVALGVGTSRTSVDQVIGAFLTAARSQGNVLAGASS